MVFLVFNQQLRTFVIATSDAHVVFRLRLVVVRKSPVDQPQVPCFVVDHNVKRFDIAVHDAMRVCIVKCFQKFIGVQLDVKMVELMNQQLGLNVRDVLKYQTRCFCGLITYHVEQFYDVGAAVEGLQNFCFSENFFSADRF